MWRLAVPLFSLFLIYLNPLYGQQTRNMPTKEISSGLQRVPNSLTDVSTTDSWVCQLVITNITASSATITVQDKQSTPKAILKDASIAAKTSYILAIPKCVKLSSGISWVASAVDTFDAEIYGFKK